jgi:tetratricopeptide (TPR) repeat protein
MVTTTLRAYLDELKLLIEQEALEEVMGHCRHILQHFPRNLETYRYLGQALLEKRRYEEAGDVFQRVLSALPDDFISHLGMSNVSEEMGQLPNAVWHMEAAQEQDSSNVMLQDELKRLYGKRDGEAPDRIQLTRGALARMYAKGKLYQQAFAELNSILAQPPERVDMLLLLAQVYWDTDHPAESGEIALRVLDKLPYSLDANRMLSVLWLRAGRPSEAELFVERLEQLDPFLAWQVIQPEIELPRDAFQLPRLDWDARTSTTLASSDVPDWVNSIGDVFQSPESVSLGGSVTNWRDESAPTPSGSNPLDNRPSKSGLLRSTGTLNLNKPAAGLPEVEVPDWAKGFAGVPAASTPAQDEVPDWFKDADSTAPAGDNSPAIPDWFDEAPVASTPAPVSTSAVEMPSWMDDPDGDDQSSDEQLPSGFTDLLANSSTPRASTPSPAVGSADMPSWLDDVEAVSAAAEPLDALAWLQTGPLTPPEQFNNAPVTPAAAEPLDALAWLQTGPLTPPEHITPQSAVHDEPDFNWLDDSSSAVATPVQENADDMPELGLDWLSTTEPDSSAMSTPEPAQAAGGELDWLGTMPSAETELSPMQDADDMPELGLDWLNTTEPDSSAMSTPEPAQAESGELDWLGAMPSAEVERSPMQNADDMPELGLDWLSTTEPDSSFSATPEPAQAESSELDWLGAMPSVEAERSPMQDADEMPELGLDWLSTTEPDSGAMSTPEPAQTESSELDWLGAMPSVEAERSPMQDADDEMPELGLDWLSTTEPDSGFTATPEPAQAESGELDWLGAMPSAEAELSPMQETDEMPELGLDWLSTTEPNSGFTATPEPAQAESGELDWLGSMPTEVTPVAETTSESDRFELNTNSLDWMSTTESDSSFTAMPEPAQAESGELDWLGAMPSAEAERSPMQDVDDMPELGLDWLSTTESDSSFTATPEPAQAESGELDWLGSMPAEVTPVAETTSESDRFELNTNSLDWLGSTTPDQIEAEPAADNNMPWMSEQPLDEAAPLDSDLFGMFDQEDEPVAASDAPNWLASMAPTSEQTAEPLNNFDFSSVSSDSENADWLTQTSAPQVSGDDWLSSLGSATESNTLPQAETGNDWLSSDQADQGEAVDLEADWQVSFETPGQATLAEQPAAINWGSDFNAEETITAEMPAGDDWLESLKTEQSEATPVASASTSNDWLSSLEMETTGTQDSGAPAINEFMAESTEDSGVPEWMRDMQPSAAAPASHDDWLTPAGKDQFDSLLKGAAEKANQPRSIEDTGVLDPSSLPDWMTAFSDDSSTSGQSAGEMDWNQYSAEPAQQSPVTMALDGFDFASAQMAEPVGDEAANWLSSMAPTNQGSSANDLDFGALETSGEIDADAPDWLAAMSPSAPSEAQPAAESTSGFSFAGKLRTPKDRVAQPANLVNTSNTSETSQSGFNFDRQPRWMQKKTTSSSSSAPNQKTDDDLPDWMKNP